MTYSIGELAELTGLSVKTIRFYSDQGVVPASGRTTRGYRRYDASAPAAVNRTPADLESLHRLARLTESERQSLINNFLTAVFNDTSPTDDAGQSGVSPTLAAVRQTMNPELPDDPTSEQLDAWLELAARPARPNHRPSGSDPPPASG